MTSQKLLLYVIEFFTGYLLQGLSFVLFVYAISKVKIDKKKYIITSLVLTAFIVISRNVNINFGVHTILNILLLVVLTTFYCKLPINKTTLSALITTVLMVIIELINVVLMKAIFTDDGFKEILKDPLSNAISAIPATTALFVLSLVSYLILTRKKEINEKDS